MGLAALGSKSDFLLLQDAIEYLTCKAKMKMPFTGDEKAFLKKIFEDLWWGGEAKGYSEAAQLADHYVNGGGKSLKIDAGVYQSSVVVKDTCEAIKAYVRHLIARKHPFATVRSSDPGFLHSPQGQHVSRGSGRNINSQGYVLSDGNLLTEQSNARLKNANNRFILVAKNMRLGLTISTTWRVDDGYAFQSFGTASFYTNIPLSSTQILKLPDGLAQYMTTLGIASEFDYWSEWTESWHV